MEVHPYWLTEQVRSLDRLPGLPPVNERIWTIVASDAANHVAPIFPGAAITGPYVSIAEAEGVRDREAQRHHLIGAGDIFVRPNEVVRINPPD